MSITDELRECIATAVWQYENDVKTAYIPNDKLLAIADRIDERYHRDMATAQQVGINEGEDAAMRDGWVELPKDADGEYIRAGDVLDGYGKAIEVVEMRYGRSGWVLISRDGNGYADTFAFTHYHAPTVEDVLREFAEKMAENTAMYVAESWDADERDEADAAAIAEYAAKLRLAKEGE